MIPHNTKAEEIKFCLPYNGFQIPYLDPLRQSLFLEISYKITEQGLWPGMVTKLRTQTEDLFISDCGKQEALLNTLLLKNILRNKGDKTIKAVTDRDRNISNVHYTKVSLELWWPYLDDLKHVLENIDLGSIEVSFDDGSPWPSNSDLIKLLIEGVAADKSSELAELINIVLKLNSVSPAFDNWSRNIYIPSIKGLPKRYLKFDDDSEVLNKLFEHLKSSRDQEEENVDRFVSKWEKAFGFKSAIKWTKDIDLGLTKIQIGDDYLGDLGFGISQLVAVLLANYSVYPSGDKPNLLLLEEPEANLHPAFQSKLADMFVDAEKTLGHQFIIETHSEYMIRKFQYLVAKGEMKPEDIVIHYFNDPNNIPAGEKQVKKINILEDGSLSDDFGPGFYDEAATWELELLKLKRSKNRQN